MIIRMCKVKDYLPVKKLKNHPDNPRTITPDRLESLKKSILKKGFYEPLLVWKKGNVVLSGNHRLKAIKELMEEGYNPTNFANEVDVLPVVIVDVPEDVALSILFEANNSYAEWIEEKLISALEEADETTIEGWGFSVEQLDKMLTESSKEIEDEIKKEKESSSEKEESEEEEKGEQTSEKEPIQVEVIPPVENEDDVPEVKEDPITKKGDVWLLGNHRLCCGDSTSPTDIAKLFGKTKEAELCFTSPPYAFQREYEGGSEISVESISEFIPSAYDRAKNFVINLGYARKNNEVDMYWMKYIEKAKACGLKFLSWNIWDKNTSTSVGQQTAMFPIEHEWIFVFGKQPKKLNRTVPNKYAGTNFHGTMKDKAGKTSRNVGEENRVISSHRPMGTIYRGDIQRFVGEEHKHPAMFPVHFPQSFILEMTKKGETVYEPFSGSGTTLIACEKTERACLAMDISERYCDIAIQRWQKITGNDAKLETNGKTYNSLKKK